MTKEEIASLRSLYAQWSTDRLARAATTQASEYESSAIALMLEELKKRDLVGGDVQKAANSTPPPMPGSLPERDTWLFPARLDRRRYAIRSAVFFSVVVIAAIVVGFVAALQVEGLMILVLLGFAYAGIGLLLPRCRDAGLSRGLAILFVLVPMAALITFVTLFFVPSKK